MQAFAFGGSQIKQSQHWITQDTRDLSPVIGCDEDKGPAAGEGNQIEGNRECKELKQNIKPKLNQLIPEAG